MKLKIFFTGGTGLLATNWALAMRDHCSVTLGLHTRNILINGIEIQEIDLESENNIERIFDVVKPQIVIHTVGLTSVEKCEADPDLAKHVNVVLAANVARVCAKKEIMLVHISTDHLFTGGTPLVGETCPVEPVNMYGRTKAESEVRVLDAHPMALVIRTNFYGWGTSYRRSFSDVIIDSLRTNKEITLFKDVFYTPTIVETVTLAVQELINLKASGIFHVVGDERISKYEFGLKLSQEFHLDDNLIKPGYISDNLSLVQRPYDMSLSNEKACNFLGRKLGSIGEHVARLHQQEQQGLAQELQKL